MGGRALSPGRLFFPRPAAGYNTAHREVGRSGPAGGEFVMAKSKKPAKKAGGAKRKGGPRLYTLEVALTDGPVSDAFSRRNKVVARTIQVRGDQTLEDLHYAIFDAFDREEEHLYEFQFGDKPMDRSAPRYVLPGGAADDPFDDDTPAGFVTETTLDTLGLKVGRRFLYWFDFGDSWMHQVTVAAVEDKAPKGRFPKVTNRVGESPPQYDAEDEEDDDEPLPTEAAAADVSCLIGEQHLRDGEPAKAVEAFTRSLEVEPTPDAYAGRARAYRALADDDDRHARELR
jgi:hypothetical protein